MSKKIVKVSFSFEVKTGRSAKQVKETIFNHLNQIVDEAETVWPQEDSDEDQEEFSVTNLEYEANITEK